jgi:hypothetical protein
MDLPKELAEKLDFSHGKKFRKEILQLFGSSVHHTLATPSGSFFLLVTFRQYTFRLTEDSVAFALASCLGGAPAGFHVQYQSDRHFCFSMANKAVGFHVYSLRRFISDHFDAYFHLWRDGSANWEREKRLWELEQQKQWTEVMNKRQKRKAKSSKRVTFASSPVYIPRRISSPEPKPVDSLLFGQFKVQIPLDAGKIVVRSFGSVSKSIDPCSSEDLIFETSCNAESIVVISGSTFGKVVTPSLKLFKMFEFWPYGPFLLWARTVQELL